MDIHKIFINIQALITSTCLLVAIIGFECKPLSACADEQPKAVSMIADKIASHVAEERFWGLIPPTSTELNLILFVADDDSKTTEFNVLAIVPEINETLKVQECHGKLAIIAGGSGNSALGRVDASKYLSDEIGRFSNFVAHTRRSERLVRVVSDPSILFNSDSAFGTRRIEQIKEALGALVEQRPLEIRVAMFSKYTDQIDVLVQSRGEMYTMSVVHRSCSDESVEVGRQVSLKWIRPDLRRKIEMYSTAEVIKSGSK